MLVTLTDMHMLMELSWLPIFLSQSHASAMLLTLEIAVRLGYIATKLYKHTLRCTSQPYEYMRLRHLYYSDLSNHVNLCRHTH